MLPLLHTTEALAAAEARFLNAARTGCPRARFDAWNARARALNDDHAAWQDALEADDPARYHADRDAEEAAAAGEWYGTN